MIFFSHRFRFTLIVLFVGVLATSAWALTSITAGDMEITSKLMTFQDNMYVARGGLQAVQKDSVLTSDRGIYDRSLELVKAIDNVKVVQPGSVMTCDYLEAYVKEDRIVGKGNPRLERITERQNKDENGEVTSKKSRLVLTCNEIEGFNKENRFLAKGQVHLVEVPFREAETEEEAKENEKKPISDLTCETLEMFTLEDKAIARNNVIIVTKTMRATGDKAIYLDKENRLIIVGHARAIQSSKESATAEEQVSELNATKIIYYPNEDRTIAVGEVHATVYPKGQKGPGDEDKKDKKGKKKKKKGGDSENASGTASTSGDEEGEGKEAKGKPGKGREITPKPEGLPDGLPEGNYTPIGGDSNDSGPATTDDSSPSK
ncbi:MAG: LptA/OstA family protein [Candidatus Ozemobacteraceae bacterium]